MRRIVVSHMFGLIDKGVCHEYVVRTSSPFGEGSLEGV